MWTCVDLLRLIDAEEGPLRCQNASSEGECALPWRSFFGRYKRRSPPMYVNIELGLHE